MERDIAFGTAADRFNSLTITLGIVTVEILPVPILVIVDDPWKLINLELLILGGMGIIEGPLFKRNKSTDKVDQPTILLVKIVDDLQN